MIDQLDIYVLNHIFSYLFQDISCFINIYDKKSLFICLLINSYIYKSLRKRCGIHFVYKPNNIYLSNIRECSTHCCKENNKIYIINLLQLMKKKKNHTIKEILLQSTDHCNFIIPYLYDLNMRAYKDVQRCSIYTIYKYDRFSSFL